MSNDRPKFELRRYNPKRRFRGREAAEVQVTWPDGDIELLWMSEGDIKKNIREWGTCEGLVSALEAYRKNTEFTAS